MERQTVKCYIQEGGGPSEKERKETIEEERLIGNQSSFQSHLSAIRLPNVLSIMSCRLAWMTIIFIKLRFLSAHMDLSVVGVCVSLHHTRPRSTFCRYKDTTSVTTCVGDKVRICFV